MAKYGLSSPWMIYYREVNALFAEDPEVTVLLNEKEMELKIYVKNDTKAYAIEKLLPAQRDFGNIILDIIVAHPNIVSINDASIDVFEEAFTGNPAVHSIKTVSGMFSYDLHFVIFKKTVVQYFTDNLSDYHGLKSTLYEDLARKVFGESTNIFYCTDNGLGELLTEWP